jgi:hypothetical protein
MNTDLLLEGLAVVAGATGALSWAYLRYKDAAQKYPLLYDALVALVANARVYYVAKADGTYSTEDQIAMGQANIKFYATLEAIGFDLGFPAKIMQITPLIPSDAAIKTIQEQINQTIATTPVALGTVTVTTGSPPGLPGLSGTSVATLVSSQTSDGPVPAPAIVREG